MVGARRIPRLVSEYIVGRRGSLLIRLEQANRLASDESPIHENVRKGMYCRRTPPTVQTSSTRVAEYIHISMQYQPSPFAQEDRINDSPKIINARRCFGSGAESRGREGRRQGLSGIVKIRPPSFHRILVYASVAIVISRAFLAFSGNLSAFGSCIFCAR